MSKGERVLITGHEGYLGSVMAPTFREAGLEVVGLDTGYFAECTLVPRPDASPKATSRPQGREVPLRGTASGRGMVPPRAEVPTVRKDLRDLQPADLEGFDAVVHLAALSNDPIGNLNRTWTDEINLQASVRLAELAKAAGVSRFLFSSSCIMYGMSNARVVTEESPLDPKTEYACSKVRAERAIAKLADAAFSPTFLRNGTIYGLSPRMRFDTVLNNLVGSAVATGKIVLHGDGSPWRPVAHVEDVARAFLHVLEAPIERVHNQAFNNGESGMNQQVMSLAKMAEEAVPGCTIECLARPDADQRTYQTDFGKFARAFPDFRFHWTVRDGARQLAEAFAAIGLDQATFEDRRFTRLKWLNGLLDANRLDTSLRWQAEGARV